MNATSLDPGRTPLRAVIVDDEAEARGLLGRLIPATESAVSIVGEADGVDSAVRLIRATVPDLIFLDVNLKYGTGFDVLRELPGLRSEVIFVTAYDQYALRAFDFAALGYLLKPVSITQLGAVLQRLVSQRPAGGDNRVEALLHQHESTGLSQIVVPDVNGFRVIKLHDIVYLRAEVNYTHFILTGGGHLMSSRTLKEYDQLLNGSGFCRVHQSYLVNLSRVTGYQRGEGGVVTLDNGDHLDVSRRRRKEFVRHFLG